MQDPTVSGTHEAIKKLAWKAHFTQKDQLRPPPFPSFSPGGSLGRGAGSVIQSWVPWSPALLPSGELSNGARLSVSCTDIVPCITTFLSSTSLPSVQILLRDILHYLEIQKTPNYDYTLKAVLEVHCP